MNNKIAAIWYKQLLAQLIDLVLITFVLLTISEAIKSNIGNTIAKGISATIVGLASIFNVITAQLQGEVGNELIVNLSNEFVGGLIVVFVLALQEILTNGRSLGKYLMKIRTVSTRSTKLAFWQLILRNLLRLIPLSIFLSIGKRPYDFRNKWSNTMVVDDLKSSVSKVERNNQD